MSELIPSVSEADVRGKRVLLRTDFNVPIHDGVITDATRIVAALPTINYLQSQDAIVILVSHLGRPKGKADESLRLLPVAAKLNELLDADVTYVPHIVGSMVASVVEHAAPGNIILLENTRFDPGETKNDPELAQQLAALADIYVNDAFGAAHRAHASTEGVAHLLPSYAGFLMKKEIDALGRLLQNPARPFIAILGGAKVSDKLEVIAQLLDRVDGLLLGGGMANTFLYARGLGIGHSLSEKDFADRARSILERAESQDVIVLMPEDVVIAESFDGHGEVASVDDIPSDRSIFDIGPVTVARYAQELGSAKSIFWNGPMGVFEKPEFAAGTVGVAQAVADSSAFTVVGGGDSVAALNQAGLDDRISHISTGGGASLEFMEGKSLPGIAALRGGKR